MGACLLYGGCSESENGGAHLTLWNSAEGVTAGGDATEQDSTIRRGWRRWGGYEVHACFLTLLCPHYFNTQLVESASAAHGAGTGSLIGDVATEGCARGSSLQQLVTADSA